MQPNNSAERVAALLARARAASNLAAPTPVYTCEQLLKPIMFLYWRKPVELRAYNSRGMQAVFDQWFFPFTSKDLIYEQLTVYPTYDYPDACFCGHVNNNYGSILRIDCKQCCGSNNYWHVRNDLITWLGLIGSHYQKHIPIPITKLESILAEVIYGYYQRNSSSTT